MQNFSGEGNTNPKEQVKKSEIKCQKVQSKGLLCDQEARLGTVWSSFFGDRLRTQ